MHKITWTEANKLYLAGEFARLKESLGGQADAAARESPKGRPATTKFRKMAPAAAIDRLCVLFELSPFEREIVLLAAGVEMDSALAAQCGQPLTFGLALASLPEPHWGALTPARPLRHFQLVELERGQGLTAAAMRLDERILHYLVGINQLDARLEPFPQACTSAEWIAAEHRELSARIAGMLAVNGAPTVADPAPILHLCGDDDQGQEDVAALAASQLGLQLFRVRADELPPIGPELNQFALLWEREALLLPAALLVRCGHTELPAAARRLLEMLPGMVMLASNVIFHLDRALVRYEVNKPVPREQRRLWENSLGDSAAGLNGALDHLSQQFRLSARAIHTSGSLLAQNQPIDPAKLWNHCRSLARPRLEHLAQRITPAASWDDLILPTLQMESLRQLFTQVMHRTTVYESWGFAAKGRRGLGISALFTGESGTGKTLAAEVLAHGLALDLYRIDLSAVVSKYIGETEKNLKQVFDAAEEGGSLLLFDEADALFGKRSEVTHSHDRYANIEVGYLLQRLETYQGLAILTTNLKSAIDWSFQRRLRVTIHFAFPDAIQRQAIWKRAFPLGTPVQNLDPAKLAQLKVSGGNICNIALNAAFLAAATATPVSMEHLLEAARLEAHKIERPISDSEIRGWV